MLFRSALIYAPAILFTRISSLLLLVVATRLIDKTEFGLLTLVVTTGEMTDVALTNWLRIALLRLGGRGDVSRGTLFRAGRILILTTGLGLLLAIAAAAIIVPERWLEFSIAVCSYLMAGSVARFALTVLQMQQRHGAYSMIEFFRAFLQLSLPVATMLIQHNSFLPISLASSAGMLVAGLVAGALAFRNITTEAARFTNREFLSLGIPIMAMAVAGFGITNAERFFLKIFHDAGAVAMFAAAYTLARQPIDILANAINMGAFPEVVGRFDEQGPRAASELLKNFVALLLSITLPVATVLALLGNDLTRLLLPGAYVGSYTLLFAMIALSAICTNLADFVYATMIHAHKRPWLLVFSELSASIVTVALAILLIPSLGVPGAAIVLGAGSITNLAVVSLTSGRLTVVPLPWQAIGRAILVSLITGSAVWWMLSVLEDASPVGRLAAGIIVAAIVFLMLNAILHPWELRRMAVNLRRRLGRSA